MTLARVTVAVTSYTPSAPQLPATAADLWQPPQHGSNRFAHLIKLRAHHPEPGTGSKLRTRGVFTFGSFITTWRKRGVTLADGCSPVFLSVGVFVRGQAESPFRGSQMSVCMLCTIVQRTFQFTVERLSAGSVLTTSPALWNSKQTSSLCRTTTCWIQRWADCCESGGRIISCFRKLNVLNKDSGDIHLLLIMRNSGSAEAEAGFLL